MICYENEKLYWNGKKSNINRSSVGLVQICMHIMASATKHGSLLVHPVQCMPLSLSVEPFQKLTCNGYCSGRSLPVEHQLVNSGVEIFKEMESG